MRLEKVVIGAALGFGAAMSAAVAVKEVQENTPRLVCTVDSKDFDKSHGDFLVRKGKEVFEVRDINANGIYDEQFNESDTSLVARRFTLEEGISYLDGKPVSFFLHDFTGNRYFVVKNPDNEKYGVIPPNLYATVIVDLKTGETKVDKNKKE